MKTSTMRTPGTVPLGALALALAVTCTLAPSALRAQPGYPGNQGARHDMRADPRHDPHNKPHGNRRDAQRGHNGYHGYRGYNGYNSYNDDRGYDGYRSGEYVYGPPPVVYAPPVSPGISLFLPLQFR